MAWSSVFDKLDDALKVVVDATFGWSNTLQEKHLANIKTKNEKEILETKNALENEKRRLESELKESEEIYKLKLEKERNKERQEILEFERNLYHKDIEFKVQMVGKITEIVSGLQNEHSRRVMSLLTEYKHQQVDIIHELKDTHFSNFEQISKESMLYKKEYPEIYKLKLQQLSIELGAHEKLIYDITDSMRADLQNIQTWLLDASRFNAEEFVLKISGSKSEAKNFQAFLNEKKIDINLITDAEVSE